MQNIRAVSNKRTRVTIAFYSVWWRPLVRIASQLSVMMPAPRHNWLTLRDIANIVALADFQVVRQVSRQLLPFQLFGLGPAKNPATYGRRLHGCRLSSHSVRRIAGLSTTFLHSRATECQRRPGRRVSA